jgi:hypothetical protein
MTPALRAGASIPPDMQVGMVGTRPGPSYVRGHGRSAGNASGGVSHARRGYEEGALGRRRDALGLAEGGLAGIERSE